MGIYDKSKSPVSLDFAGKKSILYLAAGFAAIVVVVLVAIYLAPFLLNPNPTEIWLEKNSILPTDETKLFVKLTNLSQEDLRNIELKVSPVDKDAISVAAITPKNLEILGAGETRQFTFLVNPLAGCQGCMVLPGNYVIDLSVVADGELLATNSITLRILE